MNVANQSAGRSRKVSVYESPSDTAVQASVGQLCAVRWVDDHGQPRWYITVIVGLNNGCYEVRWEDDIFTVDPERDEVLLNYNRNAMAFFQRHPDSCSVTFGNDVYLFASPGEQTVGGCLSAVNIIRSRTQKPPINVNGIDPATDLTTLASFAKHNKIVFK